MTGTILCDFAYVRTYPIADITVQPKTWLDIEIPVYKGDVVAWTQKTSATSGAYTVKIIGSVAGAYVDGATNHAITNAEKYIALITAVRDETIHFTSYTNTATTFSNGCITVFSRKI